MILLSPKKKVQKEKAPGISRCIHISFARRMSRRRIYEDREMLKQLGLAAVAAASIACGKVGEVKFELAIANDNDRTADVNVAGAAGVFTVDNVIVILDRVVLKGDGIEAVIIDTPTPFRFDALDEVEFEVEAEAGAYTSLEVTIGVANAATADAAGEPNILDRSFHLEGNLDGTGIVTYAPAAQTITFDADL